MAAFPCGSGADDDPVEHGLDGLRRTAEQPLERRVHTLGLPALVYATVSFAHAFTLLAATQTHQDADDASNADEVLVDRSTGVYASTS